jgi:hypothetical protein
VNVVITLGFTSLRPGERSLPSSKKHKYFPTYVCMRLVKVAEEPGISTAGKGEEESLFGRSRSEGERPREEELGAGREALHSSE